MTNLSDLFPAGAGKQVSFTASGNVTSSGKPVVLNSDGTVSEVSGTTQVIGTADTAVSASVFSQNAAYVSKSNRIVIFDSSLEHQGVTCTNENRRVIVNFNYDI